MKNVYICSVMPTLCHLKRVRGWAGHYPGNGRRTLTSDAGSYRRGYERDYYYRTRSVWRRCPNCGHLVFVDDDICDWCGYYLDTHPVASAIALGLMAASSSDRKRVKQEKAVRKAAAKKSGIKKECSKKNNAVKTTVNKTNSTTPKKSLFCSSSTKPTEAP